MLSIDYCHWTLFMTIFYLFILLSQNRYRLLLPSVIHTSIWLITTTLMICQLKGILVSHQISNDKFQLVSKFICFLILASIIGFSFAHLVTYNKDNNSVVRFIDPSVIDGILKKFKWIPWLCGLVGLILFIFLFNAAGSAESFSDYRKIALASERTGIAAIAQRISGHVNIFGRFYLMILGYKYGRERINLRNFLKYFILCSMINMSIGGRVWIVTSLLPFLITYIFTRKYSRNIDRSIKKKDFKKLIGISGILIASFSIIGILRANPGDNASGIDKFLYLTDGSRMTNMVLSQYPPGSYQLEHGKSTFLLSFVDSPMNDLFMDSISYSIGLSVTVKSIMPYLYYDYGFWGGVFAWGLICFFIELMVINLKYSTKITGIFLFGTFSFLLFQAPVGQIFATNTPTFEWIIIIYILRKYVFKGIPNIKNHI